MKSSITLNSKLRTITDYLSNQQKSSNNSSRVSNISNSRPSNAQKPGLNEQSSVSFMVRGRESKYSNTLALYKHTYDKSLKRQEKLKNSVLTRNKKIYDTRMTMSYCQTKPKKSKNEHQKSFQQLNS